MRLGDQSANALTWFAAILLVFGQMAMHPTARFGMALFAAAIAVVVITFGKTKFRIFAGVVLLLALFIAIPAYSEHKRLHDLFAAITFGGGLGWAVIGRAWPSSREGLTTDNAPQPRR